MSKITIVSRGDQSLLIDIAGCSTFKEAIEQLSSTYLSAGQFWQEQLVDLNLGSLILNRPQAAQILALTNGIGAKPNQVFAKNAETINALKDLDIEVTKGNPPTVSSTTIKQEEATVVSNNKDIANSDPVKETSSVDQPASEVKQKESEDKKVKTKIEQVIVFDGEEQPKAGDEQSAQVKEADAATELETSQDSILMAAATANTTKTNKRTALYLKQTLRAGQAVSHNGDLIIVGDVNAGAEVVAEGDITIWGSLRGIAHAGIDGNTKAEIRALRLQPIQIRIASYIARSPDSSNSSLSASASAYTAETAKLVNGKIRIVHSTLEA